MAAPAAQNAANPAPTPFEHKLVKFDLEGHFHYTFTVDLELDLSDPKLNEEFALEGVPLAGKWTCKCRQEGDKVLVSLKHGTLRLGIFGKRVERKLELFWHGDGMSTSLNATVWSTGPVPAANPASGKSLGGGRVESLGDEPTSEAEVLVKRMPDLDLSPSPHDVRLFFPTREADLWTESSFLSQSSPYFKTLLSSEFTETVSVPAKRPRTRRNSSPASSPADADANDFEDSDDETDNLYFKAHPPFQHERDELQHPYKEVKITKTAFTTYRAVLAYLRTGYIAFAPLSCTFSADVNADAPTRASRIEATVSSDPSLPYPVSPKSTFRLAHLLELEELHHLCLANLSKQLTINGAPHELFSDTSVCYDSWRKVILDFVVDNCDAVTASKAWQEMEGKVERDEVQGAAPIMLELFKRKPVKAVGAFPPFLWTFLFKQAKHIPSDIRPPIHIDLLPRLNRLLLAPAGTLLVTLSLLPLARLVYHWSDGDKKGEERGRGRAYAASILAFPTLLWLSAKLGEAEVSNHLDLLAFGSYGALHFASPIIAGWWIWGFGSQGAACTFGWTLGAQNLAGLATHLVFPNAAPWFYDVYGIDAAQPDYSYPGNPAGLIRVDTILGTHIYTKAFGHGPVVFGAIPSLHAATSICCGLFVTRYSRGYRGLAFMVFYCFWMFWSTQYLHHHFAIDLLCGTFYSLLSFTLFERTRLRALDRRHYSLGLTNGYERLFYARRDGENWDEYGERMLRRLGGDEGGKEGALALSRSSSGGSVGRVPMGRPGGYEAVPEAAEEEGRTVFALRDGEEDEEADDRPRYGSPSRFATPNRSVASLA
ncbi:hypothetical protein RTG_01922 [Rhodotorula toruloides ATCC 204091]|uniref:BTB domain-containing protein n=1 Tax=Rhodotorula toruloides TaxID=5286 RepID=A0A0K3C8K3_RHOTO|nr:hypothetical protein RTG_01922 [Rhodotorula toruloides ATCC 204091]